jgi:hypothetical protein
MASGQEPTSLTWVGETPDRMYLVDLKSNEILTAQFNPPELEEELKVEWVRLAPPGLSHKPLQYAGTENVGYQFELLFDAGVEGVTLAEILRARQFLQSLCYAKRGATNVRGGQAPRVLFVWPNLVSLTSVISDLSFKYERFAFSGAPTRYKVKIKLEEIRDVRLYGEDVRDEGTRRATERPEKASKF